MLHVDILCAGRLKEPHWKAACAEYEKRLTPFVRLQTTWFSETDASGRSSLTGGRHPMLDKIPSPAFVTALCPDGESLDSAAFSDKIQSLMNGGRSSLCFLVGGSDGLPPGAVQRADWSFSLSRLTFPHHVAVVLLLEQLYRAFQIMKGSKYHK